MGDIARRVMSNAPTDYDAYFLTPDKIIPDMLCVDLTMLRTANDRYGKRKTAEKNIRGMCSNIMQGAEPTLQDGSIVKCSRYMSVDSLCISMGVKNVC